MLSNLKYATELDGVFPTAYVSCMKYLKVSDHIIVFIDF